MSEGSEVKGRLEYLRGQLRAECMSYGELAELQGLAAEIEPGDVELLEAAGVPEFRGDGGDGGDVAPLVTGEEVGNVPGRTVYVVAFQHKVPGEGVGGFDWRETRAEVEAIEAERAADGFYGPEYEHAVFPFQVPVGLDNDGVTEYVDADYIDALCAAVSGAVVQVPVAIKSDPVLLVAASSHWLELENGPPRRYADGRVEPFSKEELFPILEVDVPRVGTVRAQFSVDRYVASSHNEATGLSTPLWSDWRIVLRDVRLPQTLVPENVHGGPLASGIGDATRRAIAEACGPVIRRWLGTPAYLVARRAAAAFAVKRELQDGRHGLGGARRTLGEVDAAGLLDEDDAETLGEALDLLERAAAALALVPVNRND